MSNMDAKENNNNNNHNDDSESIGSDESEDMIEVDEDEFDRRRVECSSDMKELENLFNKLKEALISEKQALIEQKLREIEDETAEEFTVPLMKLKQNMEVKIKLACLLRDYKNKNTDHIYQYEEMSIKQSLQEDKTSIYDKYVSKLECEIKQTEESRRQFALDYNWYQLTANGASLDELNNDQCALLGQSTRLSVEDGDNEDDDLEELRRLTAGSGKSKGASSSHHNSSNNTSLSPVLLHGTPYIVYSLQDYEILEDLYAIKMQKSVSTTSKY